MATKLIQRQAKARNVQKGNAIALWGDKEQLRVKAVTQNHVTNRVTIYGEKRTLRLQPDDTVFIYEWC